MFVRAIELELVILDALTLKDKRQVLQSLIAKVGRKMNVAIAETEYQDQWQRAGLGIACISNSRVHLDSMQQELFNLIENRFPVEIAKVTVADY